MRNIGANLLADLHGVAVQLLVIVLVGLAG